MVTPPYAQLYNDGTIQDLSGLPDGAPNSGMGTSNDVTIQVTSKSSSAALFDVTSKWGVRCELMGSTSNQGSRWE